MTCDEMSWPRRPDYPGVGLNNLRKQARLQQLALLLQSKKVAGLMPSLKPLCV